MTQLTAEIGLNHNGSEETALRMLKNLLAASIDAVTFQIREPAFYTAEAPPRRRLSEDFYRKAVKIVHEAGRLFGIAICDESAISFFDSIGTDFWKTLSWDFKNYSLNKQLQATGKLVFMSTGLYGMEDILEIGSVWKNVVLIHTQLSQKIEDVNLKAVDTIRNRTNLPVAFGLHCNNHEVLKLAVGFEPHAIFFYIKEEDINGLIDDEHAIFLHDVEVLVKSLQILSTAIGSGRKTAMDVPNWVIH
ncbi:MAG: N-acetylneuraminate synthase family protein [Bacteroidota bacterium]